ncbi:MAG: peptidase, partial [Bacteroidetes bacterium]
MRIGLLTVFLFWMGFLSLQAQDADRRPGEFIVLLQPNQSVEALCAEHSAQSGTRIVPERLLSADWRAYLLSCPPGAPGQEDLLKGLQTHPGVILAQFNHILTLREAPLLTPNDPEFPQQWALHNTGQQGGTPGADIDALAAWDLATGGPTGLGDTVVIAVIDEGIDLSHPDLPLWKNRQEIPGNGLDDDQNGYIDDYDGWNAYAGNGQLPNNSHGTHVSGITAAKGDNGLGITGINWDAQVMPIAGASGNEALVVSAYGYV